MEEEEEEEDEEEEETNKCKYTHLPIAVRVTANLSYLMLLM